MSIRVRRTRSSAVEAAPAAPAATPAEIPASAPRSRRSRPAPAAAEATKAAPAPAPAPAQVEEDKTDKTDYRAIVQKYLDRVHNRTSAIRAKCIECSSGQQSEVRNCPIVKCPLYLFRMGSDPFHTRSAKHADSTDHEEGEQT